MAHKLIGDLEAATALMRVRLVGADCSYGTGRLTLDERGGFFLFWPDDAPAYSIAIHPKAVKAIEGMDDHRPTIYTRAMYVLRRIVDPETGEVIAQIRPGAMPEDIETMSRVLALRDRLLPQRRFVGYFGPDEGGVPSYAFDEEG